jgi:cell wall-associated NlpC family hydrolase
VAQWNSPNVVSVPQNELQAGDLVFFNGLDHVGIYIGNGYFVDAPHTGSFVRIDSLSGWYAAKYDGAKRVVGASLESFQPSSVGPAFSSNVVYFTH